jgi:hypothetical protein
MHGGHLRYRLAGWRTNPASTPSKNFGAEQRTEKARDGVLEPTAHHTDSGKDESAEADDGARINGECLPVRSTNLHLTKQVHDLLSRMLLPTSYRTLLQFQFNRFSTYTQGWASHNHPLQDSLATPDQVCTWRATVIEDKLRPPANL